ncbi:MAG: hypothetical protein ACFFD4_02725 [Candidatus Odinarchaeota archaeon]
MIFEAIIIDSSGIPVLTWLNDLHDATGLNQTDPLIISGLLASLEKFSSEFLHESFQEIYLENSKMLLVSREKNGFRLTAALRCSLEDSSRLIKKRALTFLETAENVYRSRSGLVDSSHLKKTKKELDTIANSRNYSSHPWKTTTGAFVMVVTLLYASLAYAYRYPLTVSNGEFIFTSLALPVMLLPGFVMGGRNPFRNGLLMAVVSFAVSIPACWIVEILDRVTGMFASFENSLSIVLLFTGLGFIGGLLGSLVNKSLFLVGGLSTDKEG